MRKNDPLETMINYDGRKFSSIKNSGSGVVSAETIFHYDQNGNIVWAEYFGGAIVHGQLIATCDVEGVLEMRYHHVNASGELMTGICRSKPQILRNGRIRLHEDGSGRPAIFRQVNLCREVFLELYESFNSASENPYQKHKAFDRNFLTFKGDIMKKIVFGFFAFVVAFAAASVDVSAQMKSDNPMVGGAAMYNNKNIVENAVNSADHTTLVAAVKAAGLVETLSSKGPFTVFAPVNSAFTKLPAGTVDTLLKPENKATLAKILTYHVVAVTSQRTMSKASKR